MPLDFLLQLPILFFSIIIHEYSHGAVAEHFGDDTARVMGRLTLNPLAHIDPMGTILLPIFCVITHAPIFGWAKPVPVSPHRLRNRRSSLLLVSGVGPLSNFFLACLFSAMLYLGALYAREASFFPLLVQVLNFAVLVNLYLCVFNLLPIHPLDGSKVLSNVLPYPWSERFDSMAPYGFFIIIILMFSGFLGRFLVPVVAWMHSLLLMGVY